MISDDVVHGLWIGSDLSPIELLCIKSYVSNGYIFNLWTYNKIEIDLMNVVLYDANEIIPSTEVFSYTKTNRFGHGNGSYAGFSDIFRYKLLFERGGLWTDMDICLLDPKPLNQSEYFFRKHNKLPAVGNLMKCPKGSSIMEYCYQRASLEITSINKNWLLPIEILNDGIRKFELSTFIKNTGHEDSWPIVAQFLVKKGMNSDEMVIIHWMNEEFRRLKISKQNALQGSTLSQLLKRHKIEIKSFTFRQYLDYRFKVSRLNYLIKIAEGKINQLF